MIHCSKYLKNWIFYYVKIFDIRYPAVIQDIWIRCNPMENITFYFFEPKFISQGKIIFLSRQSCRSWSRIQIPNILRVRMHEDWFYFFMVQLGNHFHFPSHDRIRKKINYEDPNYFVDLNQFFLIRAVFRIRIRLDPPIFQLRIRTRRNLADPGSVSSV